MALPTKMLPEALWEGVKQVWQTILFLLAQPQMSLSLCKKRCMAGHCAARQPMCRGADTLSISTVSFGFFLPERRVGFV